MATPHFTRSAAVDLVQAPLYFLPLLDLFAEVKCRRRIRRNYGRMTDGQLRDIGLVPDDIDRALALPMNERAERAIANAAASEAAKW
jgi:uncharacterized protein YjiS (DUF1127 family)